METQGNGETDLQPPAGTAPPRLTVDQLAQLIDDWAATIPVRDQVNGRWVTMTLAQLDRIAPLRGAYWRGRFTERYQLGGALPIRVPAEDVSELELEAAPSAPGPGLSSDPPGEKSQDSTADQGNDPAQGR